MELFLDSASPEKIMECYKYYPLDGVTTNPTIIAREGREDLRSLLKEIRSIVNKLFVQVTSHDCEGMVNDAHKIISLLGNERLCIKIPATNEGLRAVSMLAKENIETTATAIYTPCQALLFAKAGAEYVAPYMSHIDNMVIDSADTVSEIKTLFAESDVSTKILGASFRTPEQIKRVLLAGAEAVTVSPEMLPMLVFSMQTDYEVSSFDKNWKSVYGESGVSDLI